MRVSVACGGPVTAALLGTVRDSPGPKATENDRWVTPGLHRELLLVELGVQPFLADELGVRAALDDPAALT